MRNKDLKKKLKNLRETSINESSFLSTEKNLKKYMDLYSPKNEPESLYQKSTAKFYRSPALKFATVMVVFALILGGGRAVYASQASLPGEALYPIKLITENLKGVLIFDQTKKANFEISLAEKRIDEIKTLRDKGITDSEEIIKTKNRINIHLDKAERLSSKETTESRKIIEKNIKIIEREANESSGEDASIEKSDKINNIKNPDEKTKEQTKIESDLEKEISSIENGSSLSNEKSKDLGKKPEKGANKNKDR